MAQFKVTGGGQTDSGDKRITRQVVVATGGENPAPQGGVRGRLTSVNITEEAAGLKRGVFEYTEGGAGDANYNQYGNKIEMIGGTREVPLPAHPIFKTLSEAQLLEVQKAVDTKKPKSFSNLKQKLLYRMLASGVESVFVPAVTVRVSRIESNLPRLTELCQLDSPPSVGNPKDSVFLVVGKTATPIGDKYEVTTEYMAIPNDAWVTDIYK